MLSGPDRRVTIKNHSAAERERFPLGRKTALQVRKLGSGTFVITKPKRKKAKMRQTRLKNLTRGSRK
jgi:hypothetical protein